MSLVLAALHPQHPAWCLPSEDPGISNPTHWQRWWILQSDCLGSNLTPAPCWLEILSRPRNVFAPQFSHAPNENGNAHATLLKGLLWGLNELMWANWLEGSQLESKLSSQGMLAVRMIITHWVNKTVDCPANWILPSIFSTLSSSLAWGVLLSPSIRENCHRPCRKTETRMTQLPLINSTVFTVPIATRAPWVLF